MAITCCAAVRVIATCATPARTPITIPIQRIALAKALIDDVVMYAGRDFEAIIVFDGADNEYSDGSFEKIAGVRIMFSRAGDSADKVIEKLAWDARASIETMVVSS